MWSGLLVACLRAEGGANRQVQRDRPLAEASTYIPKVRGVQTFAGEDRVT
jgi:hypothetical protein